MSAERSLVHATWNGGFSPYPRDAGLAELLARQVLARPGALAVEAGPERLTYAELDRRANQMAHMLREHGVGVETPVGVFMGQRIEQIVAQVAICKVGGTYVPLDPDYPRERLEFMLADAGVPVVLTDRLQAGLALGQRRQICVDADRHALDRRPGEFTAAATGGGHRTHILYTSGSTGKPKGIEIVARGVSRLVLATQYVEFTASDRVAQIANFSFDAAIFEVWGALLNGGALVLVPRSCALDPDDLRDTLTASRVTVMFLTTALFNLVAQARPDAFSALRYLVVGGEKLHAEAVRAVLGAAPPRHLVNGYGPTESTTFAVTCELDADKVATTSVPIGRPIANTLAYILDDERNPVGVGEIGELYIGGDGLARGYVDRPELTAERFVSVAGLGPGERRLYRTGDQARWRPDGLIEFVGRTDFQVKIRGFRIELEEIELALVDSGLLTDAAVTVQEGAYGDKLLVAHVVLNDPAHYRQADLLAHLQAKLPPYMIPARFIVLSTLPLNANGKVDRHVLTRGTAQSGVFSLTGLMAAHDPLIGELGAIWADLLGVDAVGPDDEFFRLGGNSLLAARLVLRVRDTYRVRFPIYSLYESGTLADFTAVVRRALHGGLAGGPGPEGADTWQADASLPADVRADIERSVAAGPAAAWSNDGVVLLTGATGFLGAFMVRDLLTRTQTTVCCLVRAADEREATARVHEALAKYGLWQDAFAGRIRAIAGDLRRRRFGLAPDAFAALADEVDVVIHSAAHVNYTQPYVAHRATNVGGTAEVLRFAATGRPKPLHHVSSIAVFGPSGFFDGPKHVREDANLDDHLQYLGYDIGYSASKWAAEKMVWHAAGLGLPVTVYRPGFIMGDSHTGAGNADDFMGRSVRGAVQIGAYPDLPDQRKEFVPVDYVSSAILHIAASADTHGRAYHLLSPDPRTSVDVNEFFALICGLGYPMARWTYAQWVDRVIADSQARDNPLCPLVPMLFERVYRNEVTRWELYEGMPTYDSANTSRALAGSGIHYPRMDRAMVAKYLNYWVGTGQLQLPQISGQPADPPRRSEVLRKA